ncbi:hypothetical protein AGR2A_Cc10291 [Agrobacterium genomosp. 2 str. CFBP 5494]|uniref:Uncharacterized protein n=1 Tax=Agrobacterium genomosp. 2 str. CFBP 5494 TaxID=1183436 RepID=A0A9W5AWZ9_9HYPH|nr:hypothetical protein AGR2A_Cc10291 [Agrobacterium genomosp. 2 str. CFBP 5494]
MLVANGTHVVISMKMSCRIWPRPSGSMALFSLWWYGRSESIDTRLLPVKGAGALRSWPASPTCLLSFVMWMTGRRSSWPSSRTSSAQTSIRWKRRWVMSS